MVAMQTSFDVDEWNWVKKYDSFSQKADIVNTRDLTVEVE